MTVHFPNHTITKRLLFSALALALVQATPAQAQSPTLLISELQTGGCQEITTTCQEDGKQEFIELYNPGDDLVVEGWKVEYLSASHNGGPAPTRTIAELHGSVQSGGYILLSYADYIARADIYFGADSTTTSGLLARSGGHIRLVDSLGATIDLVSWGSAQQLQAWWRAPALAPGYSIKRLLPGDVAYTDGKAFTAPSLSVSPQGGGLLEPPDPEPQCEGILLSEILPNASGADSGKEFIEIYNPTTSEVQLVGCALRLGENGPTYNLDGAIGAGVYRTFSDSETGITLPNSTGDTVWLLTTASEEGVRYADGLADNQSWSLLDGQWEATLTPTPGQPNILSGAGKGSGEALVACNTDQERNPETNRCRKIATAVVACKAGQERNPATNRCRSVAATASALSPCKPGQTRNPETNRCRSVSTEPGLKPCDPGQERNPETNRCRKVTTGSQLGAVHDIATGQAANTTGWWLAGAGALGVTGYGIYEWRRELAALLGRLKDKFLPPGSAS